ncbi:MAG: hypothetical protein IJI19_07665 [Ruminococcus sp.]|nr:hypothetical protein [Ruminococcus sp.]
MMPKEECEELLNALLPFAVNQLKKYGEFYPFGAVMQNNNEIILTAVDADDSLPELKEAINRLTKIHNDQAGKGEIKASGICWNATVSLENGKQTNAIIISLEHRENYSALVGQPYRIGLFRKLNLNAIFAQDGKHDIF